MPGPDTGADTSRPHLTDDDLLAQLEQRLGRVHARQRLGIERDHEMQVFGQRRTFFHPENVRPIAVLLRTMLRLTGTYGRGQRNAARVVLRHNEVRVPRLPQHFDGFTLLHLSDLHADMSEPAMNAVAALVAGLRYDMCVLTGDYRGRTAGPFDATLDIIARLRAALTGPIYGVLGNHDTIQLVPGMEAMGIRMLLNECETISRGDQHIHLAGVDDPHFYRMDNIEKATARIPDGAFSILLAHTPEVYRQAAHAGFDLLLCGHTHGGQICLPGSIPIILEAKLPRRMAAGAWRYHAMHGYTSVGAGACMVPVRFNCPPEITLHHLRGG